MSGWNGIRDRKRRSTPMPKTPDLWQGLIRGVKQFGWSARNICNGRPSRQLQKRWGESKTYSWRRGRYKHETQTTSPNHHNQRQQHFENNWAQRRR